MLRDNLKLKYCFFDAETQNLNLHWRHNLPWQIAMLFVEGRTVVKEYSVYLKFNPLLKVSAEAAAITHYNEQNVVKYGVNPLDVCETCEEWFEQADYIVGHNILGFDVYVYDALREYHGKSKYGKIFAQKALDSNAFAKGIKLNIPYHGCNRDDLLAYQYRMLHTKQKGLKTSLETLGKEYNLQYDKEKLHDALYDLNLNKQVFLDKMVYQIEV